MSLRYSSADERSQANPRPTPANHGHLLIRLASSALTPSTQHFLLSTFCDADVLPEDQTH